MDRLRVLLAHLSGDLQVLILTCMHDALGYLKACRCHPSHTLPNNPDLGILSAWTVQKS